jgi:hypothetical protein
LGAHAIPRQRQRRLTRTDAKVGEPLRRRLEKLDPSRISPTKLKRNSAFDEFDRESDHAGPGQCALSVI